MKTIEEWEVSKWIDWEPLSLTREQYDKVLHFFAIRNKTNSQTRPIKHLKIILDDFVLSENRPTYKQLGEKINRSSAVASYCIHSVYRVILGLLKYPFLTRRYSLEYDEYIKSEEYQIYGHFPEQQEKLEKLASEANRLRIAWEVQQQYIKYQNTSVKEKSKNGILKFNYKNFKEQVGKKAAIADCEKCKDLFIVTNLSPRIRKNRPILNCLNCNENLIY